MKCQTILWKSVSTSFLQSGMATSRRASAEIACLYGTSFRVIFIGTALTGIPFIGTALTGISCGFGNDVCSSKDFLPVRFGSIRGVGGSFTVRELDSQHLASGDFTFGIDAKATSATDFSMLELASCRVAVSGNTCCLLCQNFRSTSIQSTTDDHPSFCSISTYGIDLHVNAISSKLQWDRLLHRGWARCWFHLTIHLRVITHGGIFTTSRGNSMLFQKKLLVESQRIVTLPQISRTLLGVKLALGFLNSTPLTISYV